MKVYEDVIGANVVELMRYYSPFRRYLDADYNNFE